MRDLDQRVGIDRDPRLFARLARRRAARRARVAAWTGVDRIDAPAGEDPGAAVEGELRVAAQQQHLEPARVAGRDAIAEQNHRRGRCGFDHRAYDTRMEREDVVGGRYAWYVLAVLVLVYVANFVDRQILSILAQEIKGDLGLSDAEIGFLYGTVFAVFYALFGLPLGRLADVWVRKSLIACGLGFWSAMTALSGTASSFASLGAYRIGVGIGEASASPAAFSTLVDWFPARLRATALSIYSSGVYIGAGIGIFLGGWIVDAWRAAYPEAEGIAPFGLRGWQVAYFAVGLPGLALALWVASLREPRRGRSEGLPEPARHPHPFAEFGRELFAVLPPLNVISLWRGGASAGVMARNAAGAVAIALRRRGPDRRHRQHGPVGRARDRRVRGVLVGAGPAPSRRTSVRADLPHAGAAALSGRLRVHRVRDLRARVLGPALLPARPQGERERGRHLGRARVRAGRLDRRDPRRNPLGRAAAPDREGAALDGRGDDLTSVPFGLGLLHAPTVELAYLCNFAFTIVSPLWVGPAATTVNELVLPRMRAIASAFYLLIVTFIGLALGPYAVGKVSDVFASGGAESGQALRSAMQLGLAPFALSAVLFALAWSRVGAAEASKLERARAVGEA